MSMRVPIYKTILIGEGGVGKTNLTVRYTENRFEVDVTTTPLMLITGRIDKLVGSAAE